MKCYEKAKINEKYYEEILENGLKVILMPKTQFYRTYAIFSTKYGSTDLEFVPLGSNDFIKTPEGIAHFLEHKLFASEDGQDVSNIFAEKGADVNAFTTNNQTAYLFSAITDLDECVNLLLDFVQSPYFTKEGIQKEAGIIEQELLMHLDQPSDVLYYGILRGLYKNNPVRNEIGGTVESIKQITEDLLYICYHTFYHPSNMTLAIVGNFELDHMLDLIKANQARKTFPKASTIQRKTISEDITINEKSAYVDMNIKVPQVSIGIKFPLPSKEPKKFLKQFLALDILTDLYFDDSSTYYEQLMQQKIINNSFVYSLYYDYSYGHLLLKDDAVKPEKFIEEMQKMIKTIHNEKPNIQDFNRLKKLAQASAIKRFNSLEYIANAMIDNDLEGLTLFDNLDVLDEITYEDVLEARNLFNEEQMVSFIIYPKK